MKKLTAPILIVDAPERSADLRYRLGFNAPDAVIFLDAGRHRTVLVAPMEKARARQEARGVRVLSPDDVGMSRHERRRLSGWALALLRHARVERVRVAGSFPLAVARQLESHGIRVDVQEGPLYSGRERKRPVEVLRIRESQQAAVRAMNAAAAMIARSRIGRGGVLRLDGRTLTAERIRSRVLEVLLARQCMGRDVIVAGGRQAANPHSRGEGPLRAGEPIVLDIFPQHMGHGYWGDLTRTVVRGRPPARLKRMYAAVRAAQAAALRAIRPGVRTAAVHRAAAAELERRGFRTDLVGAEPQGFIHGTGHGVGLEIHEPPSLGSGPGRLRIGHVVTVEPGLYYPDIGGVRIEDMVVVTRGGWKALAMCPKRFIL